MSADLFPLRSAGAGERIRPGAQSPRGQFVARVVSNRPLCTDHFRLTLAVPGFPASVPGQFVQLDCRDHSAEAETPREFEWPPRTGNADAARAALDPDFAAPMAYLRRPFSIADQRPAMSGTSEIDIIHRVVGRGTGHLATLAPGQEISLLGPLGVGFIAPAQMELACLVGGGVGVPPMLYLAKALSAAAHQCKRVAFLGAQRKDLLAVNLTQPPAASGQPGMTVAELTPLACTAAITTDDGSLGLKGFVTQSLRQFLAGAVPTIGPAKIIVYCCGPTPMMKATAKVAADFGLVCQVSLEQPMACGMGTCQSCIIKYRPHTTPDAEWSYKLTCTQGPVFDTRDIVW